MIRASLFAVLIVAIVIFLFLSILVAGYSKLVHKIELVLFLKKLVNMGFFAVILYYSYKLRVKYKSL